MLESGIYDEMFDKGDTYYMDAPFCQMVEQLTNTVPEDLAYQPEWLQSPHGWMLLATPLTVAQQTIKVQVLENRTHDSALLLDSPVTVPMKISAVMWMTLTPDQIHPTSDNRDIRRDEPLVVVAPLYDWAVIGRDYGHDYGFGVACWFYLQPGLRYNEHSGVEIIEVTRWMYAALYLMAQRLAATMRQKPNRAERRRVEHEHVQFDPIVRVVTLRRLEQSLLEKQKPRAVDFQCQWLVHWHWRNQYYPATDEHKWIAIDTYVKGPPDKPLKQPGATIFVARR